MVIFRFNFAFQDPDYLFMCMELVPGGILLDLITRRQRENEAKGLEDVACDVSTTVFYISEIVLALEYIHGLGILHRDLKPESKEIQLYVLSFFEVIIVCPTSCRYPNKPKWSYKTDRFWNCSNCFRQPIPPD